MGKCCDQFSVFILEWIVIVAAMKVNYKSLDEFEFLLDPIAYYGVSVTALERHKKSAYTYNGNLL